MNTRQFLFILFRSTFPTDIIYQINKYCNRKLTKHKYKKIKVKYKLRNEKKYINRHFIKKY